MGDLFEPVLKLKQKLPQLEGLAEASEIVEKTDDEATSAATVASSQARKAIKKKGSATKSKSAAAKSRKL